MKLYIYLKAVQAMTIVPASTPVFLHFSSLQNSTNRTAKLAGPVDAQQFPANKFVTVLLCKKKKEKKSFLISSFALTDEIGGTVLLE